MVAHLQVRHRMSCISKHGPSRKTYNPASALVAPCPRIHRRSRHPACTLHPSSRKAKLRAEEEAMGCVFLHP